MAQLAKHDPPSDPVAHHGFVVDPPAAPGDPFTVTLPGFDDLHVSQIRRWMPRGEDLPAEGDEVLVLVDDRAEPWVVAWWPG